MTTPNQPTGMNELRAILSTLAMTAYNSSYLRGDITDLSEVLIQEIVARYLPKSYKAKAGLDVAQLWDSADATDGYNQALQDVRHDLQQAGLLRGEDVTKGGTE